MNAWQPSVSSLYRNIEVLAAAQSPRSYALRLGSRWGFGLPTDGRTDLTEFSFPLQPVADLPELLRQRSGLDVRAHHDPTGTAMYEYLRATGEPVIAVVDSFHLPYRPAFHRVHSSRTIIVEAVAGAESRVEDCWAPAYRGPLPSKDLDAARHSRAQADLCLEPVFWGVHAQAQWFTVAVRPLAIGDRRSWARATVSLLVEEMTAPRYTADAIFGLDALRKLVELVTDGDEVAGPALPRRTLALVLRAELGSRRYLCSLLRNVFLLIDQPELASAVDRYQQGLRHFQAARDMLVKSLRRNRPEYDVFLAARCRAALANEEQLLAAVQGALEVASA